MNDQDIIEMKALEPEDEGRTVTVAGIPSHRTTETEAAYGSLWLQDGNAVEVVFDEETWHRHASDLLAPALLIRGKVEIYKPAPDALGSLLRLRAEYAEPRKLLGVTTEGYRNRGR